MPENKQNTSNKKHSLTINRHKTSITLEEAFWEALKKIADENKISVNSLIEKIDTANPENLSSAVRVFIFNYYKNKYGF